MPRTARLRLDGYPVHIVQRGHNKQPCFFQATDYELYLGLLAEYSRKWDCRVHAYVLMTNHVHLLLTPADGWAFTRLMRSVNQKYCQYVNRSYARCGSVWQGRFWSSIVDTDSYLLTCQRYIELNPVRAGMVAAPEQYPHSSFATNGLGTPSLVVTPSDLYLSLAESESMRRRVYRGLFAERFPEAVLGLIRQAIMSGTPLGSPDFVKRVQAQVATPALGDSGTKDSRGAKPECPPARIAA